MRPGILTTLLLGACGQSASPAEALRDRQLAELKGITDECGLPASALQLDAANEVSFEIKTEVKFESVECVARMLKNSDLRLKMGFVGNEVFEPGNTQ